MWLLRLKCCHFYYEDDILGWPGFLDSALLGMTVLENIAQSRIQHLEPSGQKVIKSAKNGAYWPIAGVQAILPDRSLLKIGRKCQNSKMRHFE